MMNLKLSKELYAKEAIIKAAYFFTDKLYLELDADDKNFYVSATMKDGETDTNIEKEFMNEIIIQTARLAVSTQTKNIREMIIGRALASTIIDTKDTGFVDDESISADEILNNWFDDVNV